MWHDRFGIREGSIQYQILSKFLTKLESDELALLEHARIPDVGWSEHKIQSFLLTIAKADSPFHRKCGLGEREGRISLRIDSSSPLLHGARDRTLWRFT